MKKEIEWSSLPTFEIKKELEDFIKNYTKKSCQCGEYMVIIETEDGHISRCPKCGREMRFIERRIKLK